MAAHHQLVFPLTSTVISVRQARHRVVAAVRAWDVRLGDEALDGVELVAGELIANAVRHAAPGPITVSVRQDDSAVVVEVQDTTSVLPHTSPVHLEAESGRGLQLVSVLADRHGADLTADGKRCWAAFDLPRSTHGRATSRESDPGPASVPGRAGASTHRTASRTRSSVGGSTSHIRVAGRCPAGVRADGLLPQSCRRATALTE